MSFPAKAPGVKKAEYFRPGLWFRPSVPRLVGREQDCPVDGFNVGNAAGHYHHSAFYDPGDRMFARVKFRECADIDLTVSLI